MNDRIFRQYQRLKAHEHHQYWRDLTEKERAFVTEQITDPSLSYLERHTRRLELFLDMETPVYLEDTRIQGVRTIREFPDIYRPGELDELRRTHYIHEKGLVTNLAWDYGTVLEEGLEGRRKRLLEGKREDEAFVRCAVRLIDKVETFADRYAKVVWAAGGVQEAEEMRQSVRYGAETMAQALQFFRILHFSIWASGCYHNTVGRFDQWIHPFYERDIKAGRLNKEQAFDLIEDFFLSFNRDHDLYYGRKNNGQSIMLAGVKRDGSSAVNEITYLCLDASKDLRLVDPKINVRVDSHTPVEFYEYCTQLTKTGLGFPQYSNDDLVIPGLTRLGYDLEDARDYSVAACWEFIVPGVAMDIPNIGAMPLAQIADETIREHLMECDSVEALYPWFYQGIRRDALSILEQVKNLYIEPAPLLSILMKDRADVGRDISQGAKYNNYGLHGTGFACAADQFAAIDSLIFRKKQISRERLLAGLENNFAEDRELRYLLRHTADKLGKDAPAKEIGNQILGLFADALEGLHNERGGILRPGTGTAMYYIRHSSGLHATADGRDDGEAFPANFSPSLFVSSAGPFSVVSAFSPKNLVRAINGGPLTLEIHHSVLKSEEGIKKTAALVRTFIMNGGHQLQINAVNNEDMKQAQKHPEDYRDLVVRVWGWSGYFVELDKCYQDQIIRRHEFGA